MVLVRFKLQLCLVCIGFYTPSMAQDSLVRNSATAFWQAFVALDTAGIHSLYVSPSDFWSYIQRSYSLGVPQDSLLHRYHKIHQGYWTTFIQDVRTTYRLGQKELGIRWDRTELQSIEIDYLERTRSGFLFTSYTGTLVFRHKKSMYAIVVDGWITTTQGASSILSNTLIIKKL